MTAIYSFDDVQQVQDSNEHDRAFWTLNLKDDDCVKEWITSNWDKLRQADLPRIQNMLANMAAYRGINYKVPTEGSRQYDIEPLVRAPRVGVNLIYDNVEEEVSKVTVYRPTVACNPQSSDYDDETTGRIADDLVEFAFTRGNAERLIEYVQRGKKLLGESFAIVEWDKNLGRVDEDWKEAKRKHGRVPLIGEDGKQVVGTDGDPLWVDRPLREGDFYYRLIYSWNLQFQRKQAFEETEWAIEHAYVDADDLKADYPHLADKIKASSADNLPVTAENYDVTEMRNRCELFTLYHKPTSRLGFGRLVKCTRDVVLCNEDMPEHWRIEDDCGAPQFPFARITDIDPPGCVRGYSSVDFGRQLNNLYSNFTTMMARSIFQSAHHKWMVPRGTAKLESLSNGDTVVQYKGAVPPQSVAPNPVSPALWAGRDSLMADFQKVMGSSGVSRGTPPPGVKAWHAIQYLDELENERRNVQVLKHNQLIVQLARCTLTMMGCHYDSERIRRIIGKENAGDLKGFEPMRLASIYSIVPQVASGLSKQKSMRVAQIIDLKQTFPTIVPDEEVINMMGYGDEKGFRSAATVSVRMAESENEQFLRNRKVKSPMTYENHIIHYGIHKRMMEDTTFNLSMKDGAKEGMIEHMEATELLMLQITNRNPSYAMLVMQRFPDFPVFVKPEEYGLMDPMMIIAGQQAAGQAQPGAMAPEQQTAGDSALMTPAMGAELTTSAQNPLDVNAVPVEQGQAAMLE
jgi:hypothetical protein